MKKTRKIAQGPDDDGLYIQYSQGVIDLRYRRGALNQYVCSLKPGNVYTPYISKPTTTGSGYIDGIEVYI